MALQLKLKDTDNINLEGTRVYLIDNTGDYSLTNLGGYGLPNATRNSMALVVLGLLKSSKGDVVTSFEPYNALTTSTFNAIVGQDGWYTFSLISLPIFDELLLSTYNVGDVFYDASLYKVFKVSMSTDIVPVKLVKEIPLIELKESNYIVSTVEKFFIANSSKVKLRLNAKVADLIFADTSYSDKRLIRYKDNYNVVRAVLQGAIYEYCRGNKYVAQKDIEFLNSNNYVLD